MTMLDSYEVLRILTSVLVYGVAYMSKGGVFDRCGAMDFLQ